MQIYLSRAGQQFGPFDEEAVRAGLNAGSFLANDMAWYEGVAGWAPLSTLPGFAAPVPPAFPAPAGMGGYPTTPRPSGSRAWVWILSGCGFLLLLGVAGIAGLAWLGQRAQNRAVRNLAPYTTEPTTDPSPSAAPTPTRMVPPVPPVPPVTGTKHFVSSRTRYTDDRAKKYVEFSFDYPTTWTLKQGSETQFPSNFVEVDRSIGSGAAMERVEAFNVGNLTVTKGIAAGPAFLALAPTLISQFEPSLVKGFPNYQKISEGPTRVGPYQGYELRASARLPLGTSPNADLWMRWVLVPPTDGGTQGVILVMLTTSVVPGMRGIDDVGTKGDLAIMANSFRFGR